MLELRPTCENCNCQLPPESTEARICSFECTFCAQCVATVLDNVCPNCGGGFKERPIRPAHNWKDGNYLGDYPGSNRIRHTPVDATVHANFASLIKSISPENR